MEVIPFLEYLSEDYATRELAESLGQVFRLRGRADCVPTGLNPVELHRAAS